jgi:glyoxylase-like metal-dependent hydrolase (beta-lactamase superfamily II)
MAHIRERTELCGLEVTTLVTGTQWRQNCYLVRDIAGDATAIIDPGGEADAIAEEMEWGGYRPALLLLTHGHHDHVGAVAALTSKWGLPAYLGEADAKLARQAPTYALAIHRQRIPRPEPLFTFAAGATFPLGSHTLRALETPGHTPGSVAFVLRGVAFTGDTLLREAVGRTDLPGGDAEALRQSVRELLSLPGVTRIFPGHGASWTIAEAATWWQSAGIHAVAPQPAIPGHTR